MKIYHISQSECTGYDTYSDAVVYANDVNEARTIHPHGREIIGTEPNEHGDYHTWPQTVDKIDTFLIGETIENPDQISPIGPGVICASFHAG